MNILGIHDGHNSSACVMSSGKLVCAVQEERLRKIKNYWAIPTKSIDYCLEYSNLKLRDIDYIAVATLDQYTKLNGHVSKDEYMGSMKRIYNSDFSFKQYLSVIKQRLLYRFLKDSWYRKNKKIAVARRNKIYYSLFPDVMPGKINFIDHHVAHFATAAFGGEYYKYKKYLVFTCDGQGDGRCATVHLIEKDGTINFLSDIEDNYSIANLYALITCLLGFVVHEHEYKLMGMAPYANKERSEEIGKKFLSLFNWNDGNWNLKPGINRILDVYEKPLINKVNEICKYKRFDDICGGIQYAFEKIILKWISYYTEKYEVDTIALSGGAFMNVKTNMLISQIPHVKDMFVFPSCSDETISIGAAMYRYFQCTNRAPESIKDVYLGKSYHPEKVKSALESFSLKVSRFKVNELENIEKEVAVLLSKNQVVARFKGRSEFGARALGNRSILAHPSEPRNIMIINNMIKKRDFWMPFASSVLDYRESDYLINPKGIKSPYMIIALPGGKKVEELYAGTHPQDCSVRPQIITADSNPSYYNLLKYFEKLTGIGGVLNTSFNLHGYPLVESPEDALEVFFKSGLKFLALENFLVVKEH